MGNYQITLLLAVLFAVILTLLHKKFPDFSVSVRHFIETFHMRRATLWHGDVLISVLPKVNFHIDDMYTHAQNMRNHFFSKDEGAHILHIHFPDERLLVYALNRGESCCAFRPRHGIPKRVTKEGTLLLMCNDEVVYSLHVRYDPRRPTITKDRAIVYANGPTGTLQGILYVRAGPEVSIHLEELPSDLLYAHSAAA